MVCAGVGFTAFPFPFEEVCGDDRSSGDLSVRCRFTDIMQADPTSSETGELQAECNVEVVSKQGLCDLQAGLLLLRH